MQIDWLSGYTFPRDPVYRTAPIWSPSRFLRVSPSGEILSETPTLTHVEGSYGSSMSWGSHSGTELYLSGNPVKFLQGHNLFGSADALSWFFAAGVQLRLNGGEFPGPETWEGLELELPNFTRLDVTRSYRFETQSEALKWIRWVAGTAHVSRLKKSLAGSSTVYFGMGSRRWSVKVYSKLAELQSGKKGHQLAERLTARNRRRLMDWADGVVRFEVTIRSLELKQLPPHLHRPQHRHHTLQLWQRYHDRIQYNRNVEAAKMKDFTEDLLSPSERQVLELWRRGADLVDLVPRATWYRRRRAIFEKVGVDIAEEPLRDECVSMVELDAAGWDPEPLEDLQFDPEEAACQYPLKRAS